MQRRGESEQPAKGRRPRAVSPKARKAPTVSAADLQAQLDRCARELDEALQQQTATSEVLGIIRRSPADAQPVFDAIVQSAARLCGANVSAVYLYENDRLRIAATNNFTPEATSQLHASQQLTRPERSHLAGRAILDRALIHVPDVLKDPEYSRELALAGGWRAALGIPLLCDGKPVGALSVAKAEPTPFSDRQIELLKTFADQAVIAIENVRLFEAEQARTRELSESLEQQTATSEVLSVISSSVADAQPVFEIIAKSVAHLCGSRFCHVYRFDGELIHFAATYGYDAEAIDALRRAYPIAPGRKSAAARAILNGAVEQIPDINADPDYKHQDTARIVKFQSIMAVPMLRAGHPVGAIAIARPQTGYFPERQIELVRTFADQAVIAIENARLLSELHQRTDDLT